MPPKTKRLNTPVVISNRVNFKQYPLLLNVINTDCNVLISGGSSIYKFCIDHSIADEIIINRIAFKSQKYSKLDFDTFGLSSEEISLNYSLKSVNQFEDDSCTIFQEIYIRKI